MSKNFIKVLVGVSTVLILFISIGLIDRKINGIPKPHYLKGLRYEIKQLFNPYNSGGLPIIRKVDAYQTHSGNAALIIMEPERFEGSFENEMFIWLVSEDIFRFITRHYKDIDITNITVGYTIGNKFEEYYNITCRANDLKNIDWLEDNDYIAIVRLPNICRVNLNRFKKNEK